jgi:hypothetical protein
VFTGFGGYFTGNGRVFTGIATCFTGKERGFSGDGSLIHVSVFMNVRAGMFAVEGELPGLGFL